MLQTGVRAFAAKWRYPLNSRRDSVADWYSQLCWGWERKIAENPIRVSKGKGKVYLCVCTMQAYTYVHK